MTSPRGTKPCPSGTARLPRSARLLRRSEFARVFQEPLRCADRYFTVLAKSGPASEARLGLAISKKQARRAVDRNRLKRLARESFRAHRPDLGTIDVVVMARAPAVGASNPGLRRSLDTLFTRIAAALGVPARNDDASGREKG